MLVFFLSSKDITDYTMVDTEYWRETPHRLLTKTAYEYNDIESIKSFPKTLGEWKGFDYKYKDVVYKLLNANMLLSRGYQNKMGDLIYVDIINSKTGESFHKQSVCVKGAGWTIDNDVTAEFKIADPPNPFTKLYANRLDISKGDQKQIVIYWFMFKKFGDGDAVTMIRVSVPSNYNENNDETFDRTKTFVESQLFDAMYEKSGTESITTWEYIIEKYGNKGLFAMIMMLLIPIGITVIGIRQRE